MVKSITRQIPQPTESRQPISVRNETALKPAQPEASSATPARFPAAVRADSFRGIALHAAAKSYGQGPNAVRALSPISLALNPGEVVTVVGPSGCGKSTLLRMMAGLEPATEGTVQANGMPVSRPLADVGVVFQRDLLLDWRTVLDNVLLAAEIKRLDPAAARSRALDLLQRLGVASFASRYPWELSGGMRQRAAIARALLPRPAFLLLDEPFSALDALMRDQMNVLLQEVQLAEGVGALLITHSIAEAVFLADRVIVMSDRPGRILDEIRVDFPRPRHLALQEEAAFGRIVRRIRLHFEQAGILVG